MHKDLKQALDQGHIRNFDYYFAQHITEMDGRGNEEISLLAALTSLSLSEGHVCLDLESVAGRPWKASEGLRTGLQVPSLDVLQRALRDSAVVVGPGEQAPLILDGLNRLYLGRYWWYEKNVADSLHERAKPVEDDDINHEQLSESLERMFPKEGNETNWQMVAAAMAALSRFAVISGGPGTGKTHTVTSILALLIEQSVDQKLNILLAAPTGKAAARLTESLRQAKPGIACSDEVREMIPEQASTIHRLIGIRPGHSEPIHHKGNPLHADLLVIDEASMIDLPLMARLLQAVPSHARIIMLGDKDQLASVEAGSVFADISGESAGMSYSESFLNRIQRYTGQTLDVEKSVPGFGDCVVQLRKSYRFDNESSIGSLSKSVNQGGSERALQILTDLEEGLSWPSSTYGHLTIYLEKEVVPLYAASIQSTSVHEAIEKLNRFRILCALRKTPEGVEAVNKFIEKSLIQRELISGEGQHYLGRPIMVTRNDYNVNLFNGDIGILWPDIESGGELRAWFVMPDNSMRKILPSRLPQHETAYAMTIHKSQGSEFEQVLMILPDDFDRHKELLTRELLYTGITRARKRVDVWGDRNVISQSIQERVSRFSGLYEKLYR